MQDIRGAQRQSNEQKENKKHRQKTMTPACEQRTRAAKQRRRRDTDKHDRQKSARRFKTREEQAERRTTYIQLAEERSTNIIWRREENSRHADHE